MTAPHGTRYRYAAGCTCTGCYTARRAWLNRRARKRAMGQSAYVPAGPVRAHVRSLMDAGMGYPQVAKVSGVDQSSLIYLMCGKSTRTGTPPAKVSAANARALLAVAGPELADGARIVHVGAQRRARALVAVGWGIAPLAREIPMSVTILRRIIAGQPVWKASADAVVAAYDRLWDQLPEQGTVRQRAAVTQARMLAARKGWTPPMSWDDSTIDDPAAEPDVGSRERWGQAPDEVEVAEIVAGRLRATRASKASRQEAFARLFNAALSIDEDADRMQVSTRTAERAKARHAAAEVSEDVA